MIKGRIIIRSTLQTKWVGEGYLNSILPTLDLYPTSEFVIDFNLILFLIDFGSTPLPNLFLDAVKKTWEFNLPCKPLGLEFNRIVWSRVENIIVGALLIVLWLLSQSLPMLTMFNT